MRSVRRMAVIWVILALMAGCITVKVSVFEEPGPLKETVVSGSGPDKILLLDVSGMIMETAPRRWLSLPGLSLPARIKEELEKAAKDKHIKAVVVRLNSPGGTVSGSDVIYHEIMAFKKEHHLPVVACLMGLATSGGYYVAQAGDVIVAQPACITGSIGVLAMKFNFKGLMDKVGLESELVKSGRWKDFWSPFRPATPEEKRMMQAIIDDFYRSFTQVVAAGRNMTPDQVRRVADGRIFTAAQAKELKLVDDIGYLDDAIKLARTKAGLTEAKVVRYHRPGAYKPTIYSLASLAEEWQDWLGPQFLYMWWPGEM
jgi:protease-4